MSGVFTGAQDTILSVVQAVLPLVVLFIIFQVLWLKLPRNYVTNVLKGTLIAALGLLLFLQGVRVGFMPFGQLIGEALGSLPQKWLLAPFGFVLGLLTTWGEPSVRILADQVEEASGGTIPQTTVVLTISIGVGLVVGLGTLRIAFGIPLTYIVVPGYILSIVIMFFADKEFVAIAVDSSGVATGPMANTFLLALGLGIASAIEGADPLTSGLGLMGLIALAPIISIMILGFFFRLKTKGAEKR